MVAEFEIQNMHSLQKITFGQNNGYDYVFKGSDLDWGFAAANHSTYTYPGQIGVSVSSTSVKGKDVTLIGYVYYNLTEDEKYGKTHEEIKQYAYERILEKKRVLENIVNPFDNLRVIIGDYYIEGKPNRPIVFSNEESENHEYFCKFLIDIFCADPMFKKNTLTKKILSRSEGKFIFPWIITDAKYDNILSYRISFDLVEVENEGSVTIGGSVILIAKGTVENPGVENLMNGDRMVINKTLQAGEKIIITTTDDENKGVKGFRGGIEYNYYKYWNFENDWMKFDIGSTLIGYFADNDTSNMLDVMIEINPKRYSLEEL